MPKTTPIYLLWDSSHLWGLMAYRALKNLKLPCRLVKGVEIAKGILTQELPLVIVPGGNAKQKAQALGAKGLKNLQNFVALGGAYLGLCGGAGLALSQRDARLGLNLCPWPRKPYPERLQHLSSGHVKARLKNHPLLQGFKIEEEISLPVFWPGRFWPKEDPLVKVLAYATTCDVDFWLGDLPLNSIPKELFEIWRQEYGLDLSSDFLKDTPLIVTGDFKAGRYILSYSHLETPESKTANKLLITLLKDLYPQKIEDSEIKSWDLEAGPFKLDPVFYQDLYLALTYTKELLSLGQEHQLFFKRTPWLYGWKRGLPGSQLNNLHTSLSELLKTNEQKGAHLFWENHKAKFKKLLTLFWQSAKESLLSTRISQVLDQGLPLQKDLKDRSQAIFGSPLTGGGLLGELLALVEEMIYLNQETLTQC
ncbi:MAG: hypothetical protein IJU40_06345 [Desulfovibrionaceae bacterium]|nr:hypothetical protein [Desulfovibrionaceae bacterium]